MIPFRTLLLGSALVAAFSVPVAAQEIPKRKPGLWETQMTSKSPETAGMADKMAADLAKMSPQDRARMEAMMKERGMNIGAGPGGSVVQTMRMCFTPQEVEEEHRQTLFSRMQKDKNSNCDEKIVKQTGSEVVFHSVCRNRDGTMEIDGRVYDMSPTAFAMDMKGRSTKRGDFEMHQKTRWVSADCGNIK